MNIEIKNYRIEQEDTWFNLYEKVVSTNKKTGEKYDSETNLGFGFSLPSAIDKIILLELKKNESVGDLKKWVAEYKKIKEEITNILK